MMRYAPAEVGAVLVRGPTAPKWLPPVSGAPIALSPNYLFSFLTRALWCQWWPSAGRRKSRPLESPAARSKVHVMDLGRIFWALTHETYCALGTILAVRLVGMLHPILDWGSQTVQCIGVPTFASAQISMCLWQAILSRKLCCNFELKVPIGGDRRSFSVCCKRL